MRINLRRRYVFVAEQFLQRADVITILQQMRGKGMPQRVWRDRFIDLRPRRRRFDRSLQIHFADVMPPHLA